MNAIVLIVVICSVVGVTQNSPINNHARDSLGGVPTYPATVPPPQPQPPIISTYPPPRPPMPPSEPSNLPLPEIHIQTKDFTHHQEAIGAQDDGIAVKGEYSFYANGITSKVVYIADENGYRAKVLYEA